MFTDLTGNALDKLTLSSTTTAFTRDKKMKGQTTNAIAFVDHIDSNQIFYHQTDSTGYIAFQNGEALQETKERIDYLEAGRPLQMTERPI